MFNKVLIANRGEIAVRVIRACRELGFWTVAVYSESDSRAMHVQLADEAHLLGPTSPDQSYLNIGRILEAARKSKSQAIHPGYGFLSENEAFAQAVQEAGLVFIGPSPQAIHLLGDKAGARALAERLGIPVVPGYIGSDDAAQLIKAADKVGYPLLIKASAGGGGKGMRVVAHAGELPESIAAARREAQGAFGDGRLILERYIPRARHVEFQVLGDEHGNLLHLFERECSIQRRYQKIIEESPSPLLDPGLRGEMGAAAVKLASAAGYSNAGTIEFIVDPERRAFFFLEMNTRLQVEHPISEAVVGVDLVQWQIRIAGGERLPFSQADLRQRGHAIECRLYAEDPASQFLPAAGKLLRFVEPRGPGIRVDAGVADGDEISVHYDPLIAKLIVWAEDRAAATRKMQVALRETVLLGLVTNWQFLQDILAHPDFENQAFYTTWVEQALSGWQQPQCDLPPEVLAAAALTQLLSGEAALSPGAASHRDPFSPWDLSSGFRVGES